MTTNKTKNNNYGHAKYTLLWTLDETAEQLSVHPKTVSRLIDKGEIAVVRIGRCIRIEVRSVAAYIDRQRTYNDSRVELVPSDTGEHTCNSISETASTTRPTSRQRDAKLDALLQPVTSR